MDQTPALDNTFGVALIGVIVASILYGVSCFQLLYYFNNYRRTDSPVTKAVVIATWVSDSIHQALICHAIYSYLVKGYFRPQQLNQLVWSLLVEVIFNGITALLVKSFFVVRIWKFSRMREMKLWISIGQGSVLGILVLGDFATTIVYAVKSLSMSTFTQLRTLKPLSMSVNIQAVLGDVLITIMFCFMYYKARAGSNIPSSIVMIDRLISFSVQTGMLTSLCAIASLISIRVSPDTFIYIGFYFTLGRLYSNSLLATLNVRNAIRDRASSDPGILLHRLSDPDTPIANRSGGSLLKILRGEKNRSLLAPPMPSIRITVSVNRDTSPAPEPSGSSLDIGNQDWSV